MKVKTYTTHSIDFEGRTVPLELNPDNADDILVEKVGSHLVVGYLVHDSDYDGDMGDGMGLMYSFHRRTPKGDLELGMRALKGDPCAVRLDCYSRGGEMWSVSESGMQCQWDTARGAGVWVPDDCLRDQIKDDVASGLDFHTQCEMYCKQFLSEYNALINGDVYGCVIQVFQMVGDDADEWSPAFDVDSCWGLVGYDHATETLKKYLSDATVTSFKLQVPA